MAVLGVHADGVDGAVHADPGGQPAQGLDRILALEVDHFGALLAGHVQAVRVAVDGEHLAAPRSNALAMANWPTGPQPNTATVLPGAIPASSAPK